MKLRLAFAALLLTSTTAHYAAAEPPWIEDRRLGQGPGIRTGNLELHPSLAGEGGYDTNYFQRAPSEDPLDTLRFRITPSLTLSTLGRERTATEGGRPGTPPVIQFDTAAHATYNFFVPLEDTNDFDNRSRLSGGLDFNLDVLPKRPVTWDLSGFYRRQIDPSDLATGDTDYDRHTLGGGTGLTWRPGGGLFDWRVGYGFRGVFFTEQGFDRLNNAHHTFDTSGRWRFLPRTALLYDGEYKLIRFSQNNSGQHDGEIIRSRVGVNGLVTTRFAFRVMAGWGASFYEAAPGQPTQNFDGPIGNAELKFFLTPNPRLRPGTAPVGLSSVAVGYDRNYAHSYLGPFFRRDRGYLTFEYFIGGVLVTSLRGQVARNSYPDFAVAGNTISGFAETRLGARLFAEYRLSNAFGINSTLTYTRNIAGDPNPIPLDPAGAEEDDLDFQRFQAFIGVRVFW